MNKASSFNLLHFIQPSPWLNFKKLSFIFVFYILILFMFSCFQLISLRTHDKAVQNMQGSIQEKMPLFDSLLKNQNNRPLLTLAMKENLQNKRLFSSQFNALTTIRIKGLWLHHVFIKRSPYFVSISGMTDSPDKLNQFLQALSTKSAYKEVHFVTVKIAQSTLPNIPDEYKAMLKQVHFPPLYHFVIETAAFNASKEGK